MRGRAGGRVARLPRRRARALLTSAVVAVALVLSRWTTGAPAVPGRARGCHDRRGGRSRRLGAAPLRPPRRRIFRWRASSRSGRRRLDDRLVTAVDVAERAVRGIVADRGSAGRATPRQARPAASTFPAVIPSRALRRAGFQAAAAALVCLVLLFFARGTARQALDAASLTVWPARA